MLAQRALPYQQAARGDPEPDAFEQWLLDPVKASLDRGAARAIACTVMGEWRLAHRLESFAAWLEQGAPSEDARAGRLHPSGCHDE